VTPSPPFPSTSLRDHASAFGSETVTVDVGGLVATLSGLDGPQAKQLRKDYALFLSEGEVPDFRLEVRRGPRELFFPFDKDLREIRTFRRSHLPSHGEFLTYFMDLYFSLDGRSGKALLCGESSTDHLTGGVENALRILAAHAALSRAGLVLHCAGVVDHEKAYIFFGPSGAGKSTLSALSAPRPLLSDDLVILLPGKKGLMAATTPFQGSLAQHRKERGVFPVAGFFRLCQSAKNRIRPLSRPRALAEILASCPFVEESEPRERFLLPNLEACVYNHSSFALDFKKEPDFWEVIHETTS